VSSKSLEPVDTALCLCYVVEVGMNVAQVVEQGHHEEHEVFEAHQLPRLLYNREGHLIQLKSSLEFFGTSTGHCLTVNREAQVIKKHSLDAFKVLGNIAVEFVSIGDGEDVVKDREGAGTLCHGTGVEFDAVDLSVDVVVVVLHVLHKIESKRKLKVHCRSSRRSRHALAKLQAGESITDCCHRTIAVAIDKALDGFVVELDDEVWHVHVGCHVENMR